jgi:phage terminase large subunit-like protein
MDQIPDINLKDILDEQQRRKYNKLAYFFPEKGAHRRELYPKHLEFIKSTADFRESCFMAANRVGKSETGAFAVAVWLTGLYPEWWQGKKFKGAINCLAAGETGKLVRDSLQRKLLGDPSDIGSGLIPKDHIIEVRPKAGIPDAVDTVRIKHILGGESVLQFQSYDQGRTAFQATERDVVWEDEEPPADVHNEALIRTMTTGGIVMLTFTPLKGMSETVMSIQAKSAKGLSSIVQATWDDAPHLGEKEKTELWEALPPYQRDARSKGIPQLGSGAIYQVSESDIVCEPFKLPEHFKVAYGFDVGWNNTAVVWIAHDLDSDIVYLTHEYKKGQAEPSVHAASIKARGDCIGVIDPASRGRAQADGKQLIELYKQQGLRLQLADNTVEAGIFDVYERLSTGRLKIFSTCQKTLEEYRIYRRDEKGRIVKQNDHLMDALRYAIRSGLKYADYSKKRKPVSMRIENSGGSHMGD